MQVAGIAPNYTLIPGGSTAALVAGGASIIVYGIVASATANSVATIFEADGLTTIQTMRVNASNTTESRTRFVASRGISVTTAATITVLVFHSNPGA